MLLVLLLKRFPETNTFTHFTFWCWTKQLVSNFQRIHPDRSWNEFYSCYARKWFSQSHKFSDPIESGPNPQPWSDLYEISVKAMHQHPRMEPFIVKNNTNEPKKDFSRQVEVPIFDTKFNVTVEFDPDRTIDYKLLKVLVVNFRSNWVQDPRTANFIFSIVFDQ